MTERPAARPFPNDGLWAAVPTPFNGDLGLDEGGIRANVDHFADGLGLDGIFCNGLMGEIWSLTADERRRILEAIVDQARGRLMVAAVTTHFSLAETIEATRHAEQTGCRLAVLLSPPAGPRGEDALRHYFEAVCAEVAIDVALFDAATAGATLSAELLSDLCDIPNVCLIKTTAPPDQTARLRALCGDSCTISDPHEELFLHNHLTHGQRILFADPEPYLFQTPASRPVAAYRAHLFAGRTADFVSAFQALAPLRSAYNRWIMDPLRQGSMPNAALKVWCETLGMAAGPPRPPLAPLSAQQASALRADLAALGLQTIS